MATNEEKSVILLTTNDVHGRFLGEGLDFAKLAAYKQQLWEQGKNCLLIDSGDPTQGTVFAVTDDGRNTINLMNEVGYDILTVGNHDFDNNSAGALDNENALAKNIRAFKGDFICQNLYYQNKETGEKENYIHRIKPSTDGRYCLKTINGLNLLFVGITTPRLSMEQERMKNYYIEEVDKAGAELSALVRELKKQMDIHAVIAVSHLGSRESGADYETLARSFDEADLILDGHSHELYIREVDNGSKKIKIIQSDCNATHYGVVTLTFAEGILADIEMEINDCKKINQMDFSSSKKYQDTKAYIDQMQKALDEKFGIVRANFLVHTLWGGALDEERPYPVLRAVNIARYAQTNMGELAAEAMIYEALRMEEVKALPGRTYIMGGINGGAVRDSIACGGQVLDYDLYSALPSQLTGETNAGFTVFKFTISELKAILQHSISALSVGKEDGYDIISAGEGTFLNTCGLIYGIRYCQDGSLEVDDSVILHKCIDGKDRLASYQLEQNEETFLFCATTYLAYGGDGYSMFQGATKVASTQKPLYQIVGEYITACCAQGAFTYPPVTDSAVYRGFHFRDSTELTIRIRQNGEKKALTWIWYIIYDSNGIQQDKTKIQTDSNGEIRIIREKGESVLGVWLDDGQYMELFMNSYYDVNSMRGMTMDFPKTADGQSYENYCARMAALRAEDARNVFDRAERKLALTHYEVILSHLLEMERDAIIANKHIYREYPPANMFYQVQEQIEQTYAYTILKNLPKGGNLHIHTSSTWDAGEMLDYILKDEKLNKNTYLLFDPKGICHGLQHGQLLYLTSQNAISDFLQKYQSENVDLKHLADFGRDEAFRLLTFSDSERMKETDYIWDEFNAVFSRVSSYLKVRDVYKTYYTQSFLTMCRDNIDYVELRFGPGLLFDDNNSSIGGSTKESSKNGDTAELYRESIELMKEAYEACRDYTVTDESGKSFQPYQDFRLKLIISTSRGSTDFNRIVDLMMAEKQWEQDYMEEESSFVAGFDFVSEEDLNYKSDFYAKTIYDKGLGDISFYFHDGESNWADNDNVMAAVCMNTKRIGHGFNLYRFPAVMEEARHRDICLEICPISNQLLRYAPDLRSHPVGEYIKRGIPFVICSDDPQIFNDKGLTYDFWEFYYSQLADMYSIKQVIRNSYNYSAMGEKEKKAAIANWEHKWSDAVKTYVEENILACAAMFDQYYDTVAAAGVSMETFSLNDNDLALWSGRYRQMTKDTGKIKDSEFFDGGEKNPIIGIGLDGKFNKFEYCNIMYQLYKYLYDSTTKQYLYSVRQEDVAFVETMTNMLDRYVSSTEEHIEGRKITDNSVMNLEPQDMADWKNIYYPYLSKSRIVRDGSFFGDDLKTPNLGIGADGAFSGRELLHLLFECYRFLLFNRPWSKHAASMQNVADMQAEAVQEGWI